MARVAKIHKETVKPTYQPEEEPSISEEGSSNISEEGTSSSSGEETAETSQADESSEASQGDSEILYNNDFGIEIPRDEGVLEPVAPRDLSAIDFGQMPSFRSWVSMAEAERIIRKYPFRGVWHRHARTKLFR